MKPILGWLLALACTLLQRQTLFDPDLGKTVAA